MTKSNNPHHLILGELSDFLSGKTLPDTHDERYRQKILRLLVEKKLFKNEHIDRNLNIEIGTGRHLASIKLDFLIKFKDRKVCLIKYAPGSLVTRRLSTLAISRTIVDYQIPYVVITNGEDAEILDGDTGKVIDTSLSNIPSFQMIMDQFSHFSFQSVKEAKQKQASRIAYACEVDGACPCDTDICILE